MAGVSATDNTDGDLTDDVQVIGSLDTTAPGVYVVTYMVEDANGNQASATRAITVTEVSHDNSGDNGNAGDSDNTDDEGGQPGGSNGDGSGNAGGNTDDNGSNQTGGQQASGSDDAEEIIHNTDRNGSLANTGTQRALLLPLGGLFSVGAGFTAWWVSRRNKSTN